MRKEKIKLRLLLFITGVYFISLGIALSIRSDLGTTPVSSIPFVMNLIIPGISVGTFTVFLNSVLILTQVLILKKKFGFQQLLQIPYALLYGLFIDLNLYLTAWMNPEIYVVRLLLVVISVLFLALGIFLELKADVGYLPGEGFITVMSDTFKMNFGNTKISTDTVFVVIASACVLIFHGSLEGIREGTIINAMTVGLVVQIYQKRILFVDRLLGTEKPVVFVAEPYTKTDNFVITISRQYGSGGHAVGDLIAKKLGIAFYDSELIDITAAESGFTKEFVKEHEQKLPNSLLYQLYKQNYAYVNEAIPPNDLLFMAQTRVIRDIATKQSCVIVGRAADYILKGHKNCFNVFVHADKNFRKKRVIENYNILPKDAEKMMSKKDKERTNYCKYYTGREWADLNIYDLTVDTSYFGIEKTADMIIEASKGLVAESA